MKKNTVFWRKHLHVQRLFEKEFSNLQKSEINTAYWLTFPFGYIVTLLSGTKNIFSWLGGDAELEY